MLAVEQKQIGLSFLVSMNKTMNIFDLVHCNIWGPYKTKSYSGCHYFLTLVDDFNRTTWLFLIKNKLETKAYLVQFFN